MSNIKSLNDFLQLEKVICSILKKYNLEHILNALTIVNYRVEPFLVAGLISFAIRCCPVGKPSKNTKHSQTIPLDVLNYLVDLVAKYFLADPITFETHELENFYSSNPVFVILRVVGNQFQYHITPCGQFARAWKLYNVIPPILEKEKQANFFDIKSNFERSTQCSLKNFIRINLVAYLLGTKFKKFTRCDFQRAKKQGLNLPEDKEVKRALEQVSIYPQKFKKEYEKYQNSEKLFSMYNFNPLFIYPLIKPWHQQKSSFGYSDLFFTPVPDLIAKRISTGIYYQLFNSYNLKFSTFFGHVFEHYVGEVLKASLNPATSLITEKELRKTYVSSKGKVPDFVIIEGTTAILIECKATRFLKAAISTGREKDIEDSLKQVVAGLTQLYEFFKVCKNRKSGLEKLDNCDRFECILITFELLYLVNSHFFQEYINQLLFKEKNISGLRWLILSIEELEMLQPHLQNGFSFSSIIKSLYTKSFYEVINEISSRSNQTMINSFIYKIFKNINEDLAISE